MSSIAPIFTCYACGVGFTDPQLQREHYKSDWHRYNLKRKVASLTPVTSVDFHERERVQKAEAEKELEVVTLKCESCNRRFSCQNAYDNHLQSRRHRDNEARGVGSDSMNDSSIEKGGVDAKISEKTGERKAVRKEKEKKEEGSAETVVDEDYDSDDSWSSYDGSALGVEECLFCSYTSDAIESNIHHMTTAHSFFIPDAEYLVDIEGLISYLGGKVGEGNTCLWCNDTGRRFHSTKAVQHHMMDKGHCKMLHEGDALLDYSDFYDYRSSYPDHIQRKDGDEDEDDVEDDESAVMDPLCDDGYELVLPSGATIGHRSLARYYNQNIIERRVGNRKILPNVLSQYKALGWTGTTGAMAVKKAADIKFIQRARRKYDLNMRLKANKLQHYFRDPNGLVR